jgi:hypothetical protein
MRSAEDRTVHKYVYPKVRVVVFVCGMGHLIESATEYVQRTNSLPRIYSRPSSGVFPSFGGPPPARRSLKGSAVLVTHQTHARQLSLTQHLHVNSLRQGSPDRRLSAIPHRRQVLSLQRVDAPSAYDGRRLWRGRTDPAGKGVCYALRDCGVCEYRLAGEYCCWVDRCLLMAADARFPLGSRGLMDIVEGRFG